MLRSKRRHDKAQDITEKLKEQYQTVTQIAREAGDDKNPCTDFCLLPNNEQRRNIHKN